MEGLDAQLLRTRLSLARILAYPTQRASLDFSGCRELSANALSRTLQSSVHRAGEAGSTERDEHAALVAERADVAVQGTRRGLGQGMRRKG